MKHTRRKESSKSFSHQKKKKSQEIDKLHNLIKKNGWLTN